jgi:succinate dehydrogenase / fumarate reductase, flavoprotein subunit
MTEHAGAVRDENGLQAGLAWLDDIETTARNVGVHADLAGSQDLPHAFYLRSSLIAARATPEAAIERRETRGCRNRSDFPDLDESLRVNMVWSGPGVVDREAVAATPAEIAAFVREVSAADKLVE